MKKLLHKTLYLALLVPSVGFAATEGVFQSNENAPISQELDLSVLEAQDTTPEAPAVNLEDSQSALEAAATTSTLLKKAVVAEPQEESAEQQVTQEAPAEAVATSTDAPSVTVATETPSISPAVEVAPEASTKPAQTLDDLIGITPAEAPKAEAVVAETKKEDSVVVPAVIEGLSGSGKASCTELCEQVCQEIDIEDSKKTKTAATRELEELSKQSETGCSDLCQRVCEGLEQQEEMDLEEGKNA